MNKSFLIFCTVIIAFSLTAFGYVKWSNAVTDQEETTWLRTIVFDNDLVNTLDKRADPELIYKVASRFGTTISKDDLHKATSVLDIVPKKAKGWWKVSFQSVKVAVLQDDDEISSIGEEKTLNAAQIKLLQSADYSTNFYIKARGKDNHPETGEIEDYVYYFTIIPEKEAEFVGGHDKLINYLKENLKEETAIIEPDQLKPGQVQFTISKNGTVENIQLTETSGYPSVDKALVELISAMPGKWDPATNSKGEKVDQELVFFFGQEGC